MKRKRTTKFDLSKWAFEPRFQNNLYTKYEQFGKNLMMYFGLIDNDERMNLSDNKQPVTKSKLTCKLTLKSSEVEVL